MADEDNQAEEEREQEETGDLTLLSLKIPAPLTRNAKKVTGELVESFWPGIKEVGQEAFALMSERLRLSKEQIQVRRTVVGTLLQKQKTVTEVTIAGLKIASDKAARPSSQLETAQPEEIASGWLRRFRQEVENLGDDEDMAKTAFAKVLAGEIAQPKSFSILALRTLSTLDQDTAAAFALAASLSFQNKMDGRITHAILVSPHGGDLFAREGLKEYGLDYDTLNVLAEHRLLTGNYNEVLNFPQVPAAISCQGKTWLLSRKAQDMPSKLQLRGMLFSTVGMELSRIVDIIEKPKFVEALRQSFISQSPPTIMAELPEQRA